MEYKHIQTMFPCEDEYNRIGQSGTQIVLYNENLTIKRNIVLETPGQEMDAQARKVS